MANNLKIENIYKILQHNGQKYTHIGEIRGVGEKWAYFPKGTKPGTCGELFDTPQAALASLKG